MVGAVIDGRVSTKEQTENLSLPTQLRACEEYLALREEALKGRSLGTSDLLGAKGGDRIDSRRAGTKAGHERDRDEQTGDADKCDEIGRRRPI
jgi:hypothetical protein